MTAQPEMIVVTKSFYFDHIFLDHGWHSNCLITVEAGHISHIAHRPAAFQPATVERIKGWTIPGLPNLHSHCFQRGMAGLSERRGPSHDSFWTWRDVMYRFLNKLDPEAVEDIASMAMMEMLESGYTSLAEFHYLHHDPKGQFYNHRAEMAERIVAAAQKTGLGITLLPVFYAHSNFGGQPAQQGQRRFINSLESFALLFEQSKKALTALPNAQIGLAPHSLRAATQEELSTLLALHKDGPVHIHVAEQQKEVEDCLTWSGARPVEWLLNHMPVDGRWCLIHATHINESEVKALARSGAVAGLCPITEANLGDGIFPAIDFLSHDGKFGVGSDSNIEITASHELRWLEYAQRLAHRGRNLLAPAEGQSTGEALYRMACTSGAQALAQPVGAVALGMRADFVVLDADHPTLAGHGDATILDAYLFSAGASAIQRVIAGGIDRVTNGRHHRHDEIAQRYRRCMTRLFS